MARFYHRPLPLFYCDHHHFPLPPGHKFPLTKYRLIRERLEPDTRFSLQSSSFASREALLRVHAEEYVDGFLAGTLPPQLMRRIGFPWSPELVGRTLASAGATLLATSAALDCGFGGTLAGGTHHAFRDEGAGFCVFNDLAVAIAAARSERGVVRAAVIDLDVHQGDGTAVIFEADPNVFTLSLHGAHNFPLRKQHSVLDVELPDGTSDEAYLLALRAALDRVWDFRPELVLFQSGVDALAADRLGRLSLSQDGLAQRDTVVMEQARNLSIPLVVTLGGGYSDPIEQTVAAHAQTFLKAAEVYMGKAALGSEAALQLWGQSQIPMPRPLNAAEALADKTHVRRNRISNKGSE